MSDGVKVFVGNLPDRCPESSLQDLFSPYGKIKGIIMVKTYAFVHFESERDAKKAVDDLHKTKLLGKELTVEIAKSKQPPKRGHGGAEKRPKNSGLSLGSIGGPPMGGPPMGGMGPGGILGIGPGGPGAGLPNAALGLLNAVNAVKNIAGAVGQNNDQNSILPMPNSNRDTSRDRAPPPSDGYVIYERFYVDRAHPLLKGLPVPELPRVQDVIASRDSFQKDPYAQDVSIRDDPYASSASNRNDDYGAGYQQTRRDDTSNVRDDYFAPRRDDSFQAKRENVDTSYRERSPMYNRRDYDRDSRNRLYDDRY